MSLLLGLVVGGALVAMGVGTGVALRARGKRPAALPAVAETARPTELRALGFGLERGDVIDVEGKSLWLRDGWLACEGDEAVVVVLFADGEVVVLAPDGGLSLSLTREVRLPVKGEIPSALEIDDARFEHVRRLPVRLRPLGDSPAPPFDEALLHELRGLSGDVLWVLAGHSGSRAFCGRRVHANTVEYWGAGDVN
ncbi:MAG: hypothetical protein R3B13_31000 [Polyangiaceae bacterium]